MHLVELTHFIQFEISAPHFLHLRSFEIVLFGYVSKYNIKNNYIYNFRFLFHNKNLKIYISI